jgi:hypothetical protein
MSEQVHLTKNKVEVTKGKLSYVFSTTVVVANPGGKTTSPVFAREDFEDALDKVSRPVEKPDRAS